MLSALHAVGDLHVRAAALTERLREDALEELDQIVRRAAHGSGRDRDVLIALVHARVTRALPVASLCALAQKRGLHAAESVLRNDQPHRAVRGRLAEPLVPASAIGLLRRRDMLLTDAGSRVRSTPVRERLLRDPRAAVIGQLLEVRGTTLSDVLRLSSRRPSTAEIARTIAASRWLGELAVREALVRNPFTETWLALAMLPTVRRSVLAAAPLDPALTRLARSLWG